MQVINYYWRLTATGICFLIFSAGGLMLSVIALPIMGLFVRNEQSKQKKSRMIVNKCFKAFTGLMSFLGLVDFDIDPASQALNDCRGKIVIANHPSLIDAVALISIISRADCIIKAELWRNMYFRGVLRATGYVRNCEDVERLIAACRESLMQGNCLIIFPEGTRTEPGEPLKFLRGASQIALRCNTDMVPVTIRVEPTTLTKNKRWYHIPQRKIRFTMRTGKSLSISEFQIEGQSMPIRARRLTSYWQKYFTENAGCYE